MPLDPAKIRQRRESLKLSQTQAAQLAGMLRPNWAAIESGARADPKVSTAEAMAAALQWPLTKLLE